MIEFVQVFINAASCNRYINLLIFNKQILLKRNHLLLFYVCAEIMDGFPKREAKIWG